MHCVKPDLSRVLPGERRGVGMPKYVESLQTIMLATDFSDASHGALSYARQLAGRSSARLLVVHVVDPSILQLTSPAGSAGLCELLNSAEDELQKISVSLSHDSIRNATIARHGNIRETILGLIRERNVDLLVIGTRGKGYKNGEGLGSVAEMLLRAMPCPVLTVGKGVRQDAFEATHRRRVLFPTDFSETSRAAVAYAEHLTRHLAGHMLLLHVEESSAVSLAARPPGQREGFEAIANEMKDPSLVSEYITRTGVPANEIVTVASEKHVDFVVLGVHVGDPAGGTHPNGIAYDVIRLAKCPVFTLCPVSQKKAAEPNLQATASD